MPLFENTFKSSSQARNIARVLGMQFRDRRQFAIELLPIYKKGAVIGVEQADLLMKLFLTADPNSLSLIKPLAKAKDIKANVKLRGKKKPTPNVAVNINKLHNIKRRYNDFIQQGKLEVFEYDTHDALESYGSESFDWIFADMHKYDPAFTDEIEAMHQMLKPRGLIVGDGYSVSRSRVRATVDAMVKRYENLNLIAVKNEVFVLKKF